jgi:hypothetical protein
MEVADVAEALSFLLDRSFFMLNLLIICSLFLQPLEKRTQMGWRMVRGILLCVVISLLLPHTPAKYVLEMVAAGGYVWLICDVSPQDAVYCAMCSYVTQHFARAAHAILFREGTGIHLTWGYVLCCMLTYGLFYYFFARNLPENGHYNVDVKRSFVSLALILVFADGLSTIAGYYFRQDGGMNYYVTSGYAMLCCIYAMWSQVAQKQKVQIEKELALQGQLWVQKKSQYELMQTNIDFINMKCHDLKHQMAALRTKVMTNERDAYLEQIEHSIQIYDASIETGSQVLDTVLTEKSLFCEQNLITMTCVADGSRLGFMDAVDVYTIFGNALDNAIECVSKIADPERRIVSVAVWVKSDLLLIEFENYYENEIRMQNGLPITSKEDTDNHGFGVKSIRYVVERYDGCMGICTEDNTFSLRISIPLPQK